MQGPAQSYARRAAYPQRYGCSCAEYSSSLRAPGSTPEPRDALVSSSREIDHSPCRHGIQGCQRHSQAHRRIANRDDCLRLAADARDEVAKLVEKHVVSLMGGERMRFNLAAVRI